MEKILKKAELLAPAGDLEKLKIAIEYGADAVLLRRRTVWTPCGSKELFSGSVGGRCTVCA